MAGRNRFGPDMATSDDAQLRNPAAKVRLVVTLHISFELTP